MNIIIEWMYRLMGNIPEVVLDFEIKNDSVFIKLYNRSQHELFDVIVKFSDALLGRGGDKVISEVNMLEQL